jgi:hypothetical protein
MSIGIISLPEIFSMIILETPKHEERESLWYIYLDNFVLDPEVDCLFKISD